MGWERFPNAPILGFWKEIQGCGGRGRRGATVLQEMAKLRREFKIERRQGYQKNAREGEK